ncbi:MAG: hypothetical protein ACK4FZ_16395 [Vogesella sp.]|uniref:hypothetical protein n=1 Tax=Vogesella sp. TaxID=1904252 RepID=UPI00391B7287
MKPNVYRASQGWPHAVTVSLPTFLFCVPLRSAIACRFPHGGGFVVRSPDKPTAHPGLVIIWYAVVGSIPRMRLRLIWATLRIPTVATPRKVGHMPLWYCGQPFCLVCRYAAWFSAAFRAAAGYFLLRRQKKVPKEKATRGCSKPRAKRPAPGAAELAPC